VAPRLGGPPASLNRQLLAPFQAPRRQHSPSPHGAGAIEKPMFPLSPSFLRLIGSLRQPARPSKQDLPSLSDYIARWSCMSNRNGPLCVGCAPTLRASDCHSKTGPPRSPKIGPLPASFLTVDFPSLPSRPSRSSVLLRPSQARRRSGLAWTPAAAGSVSV